jgi:hypothetical protein
MSTLLHRGMEGPEIEELQRSLDIKVDGDFGPLTETAVKVFQRASNLKVDGIVGPETWIKLRALPPVPPPEPPKPSAPLDVAKITAIAGGHKIARYNWPGRGRAPIGYTKGVAVSFASAVLKYRAGYPPMTIMAKAAPASSLDALHLYAGKFAALKMSNDADGETTLRHLFVLLMGLGPRESSGKHCCGRDASARNTSADSCEAGAWQMSWDAHAGVPLLRKLLNEYEGDGFLEIYSEGVKCSKADWRYWGTGAGRDFQEMCKNKPDFAAQAAALGLRTLRSHWGPVLRREITIATAADAMLADVQATLI